MPNEFIYSVAAMVGGIYLIWGLFLWLWHKSDHKRLFEIDAAREEFVSYMKQLDAEEAGQELLELFESLEQLKAANERLKNVLCQRRSNQDAQA
jgi:hypothetical protein